MKTLWIGICLLVAIGASAQVADSLTYEFAYTDQSNNCYYVQQKKLVYYPISTETSSSGVYSGGVPCEHQIESDVYNSLRAAVEKAIAQKEEHRSQREMGTIVIKMHEGENEQAYILNKQMELHLIFSGYQCLE